MIGLCAPDVASLGKLNAAQGDKFVAGGYGLTAENLAASREATMFPLGQSPFVQGYLPVMLLVERSRPRPTPTSFLFQKDPTSRDGEQRRYGAGTSQVTFEELEKLAADPKATAECTSPGPRLSSAARRLPECSPLRPSRCEALGRRREGGEA